MAIQQPIKPKPRPFTLLKYLNSSQLKLLNQIEQDPDFWKYLQLKYIKNKQSFDIKDFKKLIAIGIIPRTFSFESELKKAFSKYNRVISLPDEALFWYWFAGLIDGDGHLRSNKKSTEIVVTMGDEDIALLYWLQHLLGGKIIRVKDKKAYRIVFLQGNCEFFTIVQHLNGKLHHPNKIKGLAQICTQFGISLCKHPRLSLQTLGKNNPSYFNAYVRGLFDADGSIYVRGARQRTFLESSNASEYWLNRRITARSLRIELSIAGDHSVICEISRYFKTGLIKSSNRPKNDGTPSTSYKITVSQSNLNVVSPFTKLCAALRTHFLPPTIKQIRLNMAKQFNVLKRPFFNTSSQIVNEQCVNWLLAWLIWPIAHKKRMFELNKKDKID